MRVLWFSNIAIGNDDCKGTGSWLFGMKSLLTDNIKIFNITIGVGDRITHNKYHNFEEFIIPNWKLYKGVPSQENINELKSIINNISPDIIHIWGLELYWGLLFSRGYLTGNPILEIQGFHSSCNNVIDGAVKHDEIKRFVSAWDLLKKLLGRKNSYKEEYEYEILSNAKYVGTQSNWTRNQIAILAKCQPIVYNSKIPLRQEFYNSPKWLYNRNRSINIYTSYSYLVPFKGFHILLKALGVLKPFYPNIKLKVAGSSLYSKPFYKRSKYELYLLSLIEKYKIEDNIEFLGNIEANQIINRLLDCNVYVNPSFVESYSVAAAEALYLGVPSVLSYSGALPDFSNKSSVALYYPPLDYVSCAAMIRKFLESEGMCIRYSKNAIDSTSSTFPKSSVLESQLEIYREHLLNISHK